MKNKQKKPKQLKYVPTGNNWKRVLLGIYNHSPHNYGESNMIRFYDDFHIIAKKLKISGYELGLAISFLKDNKLIKENNHSAIPRSKSPVPKWSNMMFLTEKGFKVAIKLENELSNQKTQNVVMIFTGLIAYTGIMVFLKDFIDIGKELFFWSYVGIILVMLFSFYLNSFRGKVRRFIFKRKVKNGEYAM